MFPTDGERFLASPASEAAFRQRFVRGPDRSGCVAHHGAGTLTNAGRGAPGQACGTDATLGRLSGYGLGVLCKAIHDAEFGAGDSYHVVRSEQDIFTVWGHLAGRGMLPLPAIEAGPCGGAGPIRAPCSGDDASLRGAPPPPHAVGPIKVGAGLFILSLSVLLPPHVLDFVIVWTLRSFVIAWTPSSFVIAWTPPSQLKSLLHATGRVST